MNDGSQEESMMRWCSAKLRMARMVESLGCDAMVDHVIVYRARIDEWLEPVLAIGRSLERAEPGKNRVEWRLAEVLTIDVLRRQNLDGAEVHSEFVDMTPDNAIPFASELHPETSTPVRRHLMTLGSSASAGTEPLWFSAKVRDVILIDDDDNSTFEHSVYLFRAADFDAAFDAVLKLGQAQDREFLNGDENRVRWKLADVQSLNLLGAGEIGDAVDVYSEAVALSDVDRVPFNFVFHPERSAPRSTGI